MNRLLAPISWTLFLAMSISAFLASAQSRTALTPLELEVVSLYEKRFPSSELRAVVEQCYEVDLGQRGRAHLIVLERLSAGPDQAPVAVYLFQQGRQLEQLPEPRNLIGLPLSAVQTVSLADVNGDKRRDLIMIVDTMTGRGIFGPMPEPNGAVWLAMPNRFITDPAIDKLMKGARSIRDLKEKAAKGLQNAVNDRLRSIKNAFDAVKGMKLTKSAYYRGVNMKNWASGEPGPQIPHPVNRAILHKDPNRRIRKLIHSGRTMNNAFRRETFFAEDGQAFFHYEHWTFRDTTQPEEQLRIMIWQGRPVEARLKKIWRAKGKEHEEKLLSFENLGWVKTALAAEKWLGL